MIVLEALIAIHAMESDRGDPGGVLDAVETILGGRARVAAVRVQEWTNDAERHHARAKRLERDRRPARAVLHTTPAAVTGAGKVIVTAP